MDSHNEQPSMTSADPTGINTSGIKAKIKNKKPLVAIGAGVAAVAAVGVMAWFGVAYAKSDSAPKNPGQIDVKAASAIVNGAVISESEILSLTSQGVDRAIAVDRYINKVLASEMARKAYAEESQAAIRGAEREVLSQLYIAKRTQDLKAAITDAEVSSFYEKNVKSEDYAGYKVRVFLTQDPKEAETVFAAMNDGKDKSKYESKFKPLKDGNEADRFLLANELPYGLGQVIRTMKKGEVSKPLMLRNGVFLLSLDEIKDGQKPEMSKVAAEIKDILVAQRLNDELSSARRTAKIELK